MASGALSAAGTVCGRAAGGGTVSVADAVPDADALGAGGAACFSPAALFFIRSVTSRTWPILANTARSACAGASLTRSLTCGKRISILSLDGDGHVQDATRKRLGPCSLSILFLFSLPDLAAHLVGETREKPRRPRAGHRPASRYGRLEHGSAAARRASPNMGHMSATTRRVLLAKPRGYCAGVDRAVQTVEMAIERYGAPVYVRKQIVHNLHVVRSLEQRGAIFVDETPTYRLARRWSSRPRIAPEVRAEAKKRDLRVIDATCPLVTKVHNEARRFAAQDYDILLIGHEGQWRSSAPPGKRRPCPAGGRCRGGRLG